MKRLVLLSAVVGFLVPFVWGVLALGFFNAPEGVFSELFWDAVYVTCPPWIIPGSSLLGSPIATPFLNALLYAIAAAVASQIRNALLKRVKHPIG